MDGAATARILTGFGGWSVNCSAGSSSGLRGAGAGRDASPLLLAWHGHMLGFW